MGVVIEPLNQTPLGAPPFIDENAVVHEFLNH